MKRLNGFIFLRGVGWGLGLSDAIVAVRGFLTLRAGARKRLEQDVRELVDPCLPLLTHKRSKLAAPEEDGTAGARRWYTELEFYVDRILLPMLGVRHEDDRAHVLALVDAMVAAGQARAAAEALRTPPVITWRVDTGWAG